MRWIIRLVLVLIIGVCAWFWYPRLLPSVESNPIDSIPEDTWLVFQAPANKVSAIFSDSSSIYSELSVLEKFSTFWNLQQTDFSASNETILFFLYGNTSNPSLGLIEQSKGQIKTSAFSNHFEVGDYIIHLNDSLPSQTTSREKLSKLLSSGDINKAFVCGLPIQVLEFYNDQIAVELKLILSQEIVTEDWVGFDMQEEDGLFTANGVGISATDETSKKRDLNLLRYLPSKTGAAMLSSIDSLTYSMIYCPYSNEDEMGMENLFILITYNESASRDISEDQAYQGIPISIERLPSSFSMFNIPWQNESYAAHFGSVLIYSSSFKQLTKLIDDYLADDKLISSPFFKHIEPAISDASFTFYMRPEMLSHKNPFVDSDAQLSSINTLVFQCFSELPMQKFYALSILHHKEFVDEAPLLWSALLDTAIAAGPWSFKNHYTKENEILVQDARHQLYLLNKGGKNLWKLKLDEEIVGNIQLIDAYQSGKFQMLFNTKSSTYLVDRNGKNVGSFPLKLETSASTSPSIVKYDNKGDYRILIADGKTIRNIDIEGNPIKGWKNPSINSNATSEIIYLSYSGKDYLTVISEEKSIYYFDRTGKERINKLQADTNAMSLVLAEGKTLNDCQFTGFDSIGNIHTAQLKKENKIRNILPIGSDVGFMLTLDSEHKYIILKQDRLLALNTEYDVTLDFLLPEEMKPSIQMISSEKGWIGCESRSGKHFYIIDLEGRMLDKMPLRGSGKALLMDVDQNGSQELILADGKRELLVYKLAD